MDESQLEVPKSLVKFKTFPIKDNSKEGKKAVEAEAKAWKAEQETLTGKIFSDVGHTDSCYYVGYCFAGELAAQAVHEAGRYYSLNVDLTAGYMLGSNWAECH